MSKPKWSIYVTYPLLYYPEYDKTIEEAIGNCDGSGANLVDKTRVLEWYRKCIPACKSLKKRIQKLKLKSIKYKIYELNE